MNKMSAEYVDHMGSDLSVVNAARVSFAKHKDVMESGDERLIHHLAKHNHWTPFAHTAITLRMKAPVPIRTQCFKHKAGFVENEESRRYISAEPELFIPEYWRTKPEGNVKQGSGTGKINIDSKFNSGFCVNCGEEFIVFNRGGQQKKYCNKTCKSKFTNLQRNPYKTVFQNCAARVKRDGKWEFKLKFDEMEFPEYCKYTGIKLNYDVGKGKIMDCSPSFDRIDAEKGYTMDNVQIISNKANTMKSSATRDELVAFAKSVLRIHGGYIDFGKTYKDISSGMIDIYNAMIDDGVAPEQARLILPQGVQVNWIWTGNLASYARFYGLRNNPDAQLEIQQLAQMVGDIIKPLFPVSWAALTSTTK